MSLPLPFVMALLWSLAKQVRHQCWSSAAYALYTAVDLLIAPIACFHWWSGVRCRPCRCRRVWRETCSSVCKPWRASSDRIWAKEPNGRSSGSKKSEMTQHVWVIKQRMMVHNTWIISLINYIWNCKFCPLDFITHHTLPQLRQWCFLRMTVKGALQAMQELQASSGTQSGGSTQSRWETVSTKLASQKSSGHLLHRKRNRLESGMYSARIFLTFKLALAGLGCHLGWGNGLLTENTVLQHCTKQNRTCWTPQEKKKVKPVYSDWLLVLLAEIAEYVDIEKTSTYI